jgi:hypothetical protein
MRGWIGLARLGCACLVVAGCGDNQDPCAFHERDDLGNAVTPEVTGLALDGGTTSVCGSIDGGHFDRAEGTVDVDRFRVTVRGSGELLVQMTADPEVALLGELAVRLYVDAPEPILMAEGTLRPDLADHAAFVATVPPGDIDVVVSARASGDIQGALPYRVRLLADPSNTCGGGNDGVTYREHGDGDDDTGNDVVAVDFTLRSPFSTLGGTPEPTGLVLGGRAHIAGVAGAEPRADAYLDRDTYLLAAASSTNELAVRLDWQAHADLDYVVFEADTLTPVATSTLSGLSSPEFQVFAVHPGASYWLWVGRYATPAGSVPAPYDVHVCAGGFY